MTEPVSTATVPPSETDRLDPPSESISLRSGTKARLLRLKMRQMFRLLRIVTRGGASYLPVLRDALASATDEDAAEVFGTQLLAVALIALPEAEDEAVEFIMSVVEPVELTHGKDKQSRERNEALRTSLADELYNPDPDDVVTIIEAVIGREKDDLVALGKRLAAAWQVAAKTGQVNQQEQPTPAPSPPSPPSPSASTAPTPPLSPASPDHSISSPASTDGAMTPSSISPSAG